MRCLDRYGSKTSLSDVAAELGVTRQTVYRLFPSSESLMVAVGVTTADVFIDRMVAAARRRTGLAQMLVECLLVTIDELPHERYLSVIRTFSSLPQVEVNLTGDLAHGFGQTLLDRLPVDLEALGLDARGRAALIEIYLRTLQSLMISPPATTKDARGLLERWLVPAVDSLLATRR
jgi:AcrR family transcriptional regulator